VAESSPSKVLIADDHALFRKGLGSLLEIIDPEIKVVEAESYPDALRKANEMDDLDLALVDLGMPGMERFAGLNALIRSLGEVPVVVVSAAETAEEMSQAMDSGAPATSRKHWTARLSSTPSNRSSPARSICRRRCWIGAPAGAGPKAGGFT
jgi:DNA-binding NarL/FixJ family response regulator